MDSCAGQVGWGRSICVCRSGVGGVSKVYTGLRGKSPEPLCRTPVEDGLRRMGLQKKAGLEHAVSKLG